MNVEATAKQASQLGQWRGVVSVNGLPEFVTKHTYDSAEAALRDAKKFLPEGEALAREDAEIKANNP